MGATDIFSGAIGLLVSLIKLPWTATVWVLSQFRAAWRGAVGLVSGLRPGNILPPSVTSTLNWLKMQVPRAVGMGSPQEQITASVVLAVVMVVSSFGFLTPVAVVMVIPFSIGLIRLFPVVDNRVWSRVQGGLSRSSKSARRRRNDVPLWRRD